MFDDTTPPAQADRRTRRRGAAMRTVAPIVCLAGLAQATGGAAQEVRDRARVTVRGTVVDAVTGEPVAGVVVAVVGADVRLESDDNGQFTITRIPVGFYKLELSHPGYHTFLDNFTVLGSGEFATAMDPIAYLADGLMTGITGVVRDAANGRPVVGATVWTAARPRRRRRTDAAVSPSPGCIPANTSSSFPTWHTSPERTRSALSTVG